MLKSERDRVVGDWRELKQTVSSLGQAKQKLASQMETLEEDNATLRQSYQQLQEASTSQEEVRCDQSATSSA